MRAEIESPDAPRASEQIARGVPCDQEYGFTLKAVLLSRIDSSSMSILTISSAKCLKHVLFWTRGRQPCRP
jgi:hypothetical protein